MFADLALLPPRHTVRFTKTSVPLRPKALGAPCLELISASPVFSGKHLQDFPGSPLSAEPFPLPSTLTLAFKMPPSVTVSFIPQEVSLWPASPAAHTPCSSPVAVSSQGPAFLSGLPACRPHILRLTVLAGTTCRLCLFSEAAAVLLHLERLGNNPAFT